MLEVEGVSYAEELRRSLDELENSLTRVLPDDAGSGSIEIAKLENRVAELTAKNFQLEQLLMELRGECAHWKATCSEIVSWLNSSIEVVRSVLLKEEE